jgi:hypothetical protein
VSIAAAVVRRVGGRDRFEFDPRFTDDKAACMIISEEAFVHAPLRAVLPDVHPARAVRHDPADRGPLRAVVR